MASFSLHMRSDLASTAGHVAAFFGGQIRALLHRWAVRSAEAELFGLDDGMLKDMGLHRSEVSSITFLPSDPTRIRR